MATAPTQPDPAEGARKDEQAAEDKQRIGENHSADTPAEGADDAPAGGSGSPE